MSTVAVIGLGYVGLPLVAAFDKQMRTISVDISAARVEPCQRGIDPSRQLDDAVVRAAAHAVYTPDDGMGKFIAEPTIEQMIAAGSTIKGANVNVQGLTLKDNSGDLRNSKVIDIIDEFKTCDVEICVTDPQAGADEVMHGYGAFIDVKSAFVAAARTGAGDRLWRL